MSNQSFPTGRISPYTTETQSGKIKAGKLPAAELSNRELFRTRASRFVDFFPDELVIQEKTISFIRNDLFVSYVETLPIRDIGRVIYTDTPFFAGLEVLGKNPSHDLRIKGLNKSKGMQAKNIIEGLLLENVGQAEIPVWLQADERRDALEKVGRAGK